MIDYTHPARHAHTLPATTDDRQPIVRVVVVHPARGAHRPAPVSLVKS